MVSARPVTPAGLVDELVDAITRRAGAHPWTRVAVDGADAAEPGVLADALVDPLRLLGRPVLRVRARDFLRPASVRLEYGHTDAESYLWGWLDDAGLRREVLDPLGAGGTGRVLPSLWDAARDRATRAAYTTLPEGGVLLLDGPLLLGKGLPLDLSVHLWLSPGALRRRTPDEQAWTLPALARYAEEIAPATEADLLVRYDHPAHPALVEPERR
ncbi:uridine kinase [Embleya sp. NBC_00888]|uniref:uridine kinase n=1 Tax=Embleya sp. NBC_00888 TaxID=2975960 RepID=UPI00387093EC|nr:uridine kinase [Embleya sp. NBC_00888]